MAHVERVVVLVDMDCFYCQVEENLNPNLKGKPLAVVQYNAWKGGGIIAVNYAARARGVTRHMRGDEAKQKCPEIELARVPNVRGKADLTKYREAGKLVAKVLQKFTPLIERASVDEAYLDITAAVQSRMNGAMQEITLDHIKNTHVASGDVTSFLDSVYNSDLCSEVNMKLVFGAVIVEEIRAAVITETGYTCSAGIAHNKILAKLACGLHKPNKQTILPQDNVAELYKNIPIHKIKSLGGKFGDTLTEELGIRNMAELVKFSEKDLAKNYDEKTANWLYNIARGINYDPVTTRLVAKSIACCKKFAGKAALIDVDSVTHWLKELTLEIIERLDKDFEENNRKAKQLVVSFSYATSKGETAASRTIALPSYNVTRIVNNAFDVVKKNCQRPNGSYCVKYLGLSAGKFEDYKNVNEITSFFKTHEALEKSEYRNNYSDDTVNLNEDELGLTFFPENINCIPQDKSSDRDSITNEILHASNNENDIEQANDPSFFLNYIDNLKAKCLSPVQRNFDTSRILENSDTQSEDSVPNTSKTSPCYNFEQTGSETSPCKVCSKKFDKTEMISHMDYHFALQMVREESQLYKNEQPVPNKIDLRTKAVKRKKSEVVKNTLRHFLQPDLKDCDLETAEQCPHCDKQIESSSFLSHLDYHEAKKLHRELNPATSTSKVNSHNKKNQNSKQRPSAISIEHFFKPAR